MVSETNITLHRVYYAGQDPMAPAVKAQNRYDCPRRVRGPYAVLYFGYELPVCWLETVVRAQLVRPAGTSIEIPLSKLSARWACEVHVMGTLRLVDFSDGGLLKLGDVPSNIMGDKYLRTQKWSRLLHGHSLPQVDGIRYRSRFKSDEFCVALFSRARTRAGLKFQTQNQRSIDPRTSLEGLALLDAFDVVPGL